MMINLIPPEARTRITFEYWVRVLSVWLFMAAVAAFTMGALLLPAYVLVTSQVQVYEASAKEASARVGENDTSEKLLVAASVKARLIVEGANRQNVLTVYDVIEEKIDHDVVTVDSYTFTRTGQELREVRIDGTAATRLSLANFRDRLIEHPLIEKVDLPISNLAKDRDIPFSLLLSLSTSTPPTPTP